MRTEWSKEDVHEKLSFEIRGEKLRAAYRALRESSPALRKYQTVEKLIGMLRELPADPDEKDRVLHSLIAAVQESAALRQAGLALLTFAMWPALEHSYYRLIHLIPRVQDILAELHWSFLSEVTSFNLSKRAKIAVNLQLNVEKRLRKALAQEIRYQEFTRGYGVLESATTPVEPHAHQTRLEAIRDHVDSVPRSVIYRVREAARRSRRPGTLDPAVASRALRRWVAQGAITADEARVVQKHVVDGMELREIARRLSIPAVRLRVRYLRIRRKLEALASPESVTRSPEGGVYTGR